MNHYAQMALDHNRRHRPRSFAEILDPTSFFTDVGKEIAATVTQLRDEILGPIHPGESVEDYRIRSYQALATAEELTLADHPLLQPESETDTERSETDDSELAHRYRLLSEINQTINTPL